LGFNETMNEVYYVKRGKRYVPVSVYDSNISDSLPHGTHVTVVNSNHTMRRYSIDPDYAPLIAAGLIAREYLSQEISRASEIRLSNNRNKSLTPEQAQAWDNLIRTLGPEARQLEWPSVYEISEAGVNAMIESAKKMLSNPTVKLAYDHFILVAKLAENHS